MTRILSRRHAMPVLIGAALVGVIVFVALHALTGGPQIEDGDPVGVLPANPSPSVTATPGATSSAHPAPTAAPDAAVHMPVAPKAPNADEDWDAAMEAASQAAQSATLGYIYYDSIEPQERRKERLSALFAPGSDAPNDEPLMTTEHPTINLVVEGEVGYVEPLDMSTTKAIFSVAVNWHSAEWDNSGGPTLTLAGEVSVRCEVQYIAGAWIAVSVDPASQGANE